MTRRKYSVANDGASGPERRGLADVIRQAEARGAERLVAKADAHFSMAATSATYEFVMERLRVLLTQAEKAKAGR